MFLEKKEISHFIGNFKRQLFLCTQRRSRLHIFWFYRFFGGVTFRVHRRRSSKPINQAWRTVFPQGERTITIHTTTSMIVLLIDRCWRLQNLLRDTGLFGFESKMLDESTHSSATHVVVTLLAVPSGKVLHLWKSSINMHLSRVWSVQTGLFFVCFFSTSNKGKRESLKKTKQWLACFLAAGHCSSSNTHDVNIPSEHVRVVPVW